MATFSDSFVRADSADLGPNWTETFGDWGIAANKASNIATGTVFARYEQDLDSADHYAQAVVRGTTATANTWGVVVRYDPVDLTHYSFRQRQGSGSSSSGLYRTVAGANSKILDMPAASMSLGSVIRLEVEGTTLRCLIDGVEVGAYTDPSPITTGTRGGLYGNGSAAARIQYEAFQTGDLVEVPPTGDPVRLLRAGADTVAGLYAGTAPAGRAYMGSTLVFDA